MFVGFLPIDFDEERVLCSEERSNRTKNKLLIRGGIIAYVFLHYLLYT